MWQSSVVRDILGIIESKMKKRKDALNMIWVCRYWRHILKRRVTKRYPLFIKQNQYEGLVWSTVICECVKEKGEGKENSNLSAAQIESLILREEIDILNCDYLPKGLKMLGITMAPYRFEVVGNEEMLKYVNHLYVRGNQFPYFLLTDKVEKLEFLPIYRPPCPRNFKYSKERNMKNSFWVDFKKFNVTSYTHFYIKLCVRVEGNVDLLTLSYSTLKNLTLFTPSLTSLNNFINLKVLNVRCDEMDIKNLEGCKNLKVLKIKSMEIKNFEFLTNFSKITKFVIDCGNLLNYHKKVSDIKIYFPPNIMKCHILNPFSDIENLKFLNKIRELKVCSTHLNQSYLRDHLYDLKLDILNVKVIRRSMGNVENNKNYKLNFSKFIHPLKELIIWGKYKVEEDSFPITGMNVNSLHLFSESVRLEYLPVDLKHLYVKKGCEVIFPRGDSHLNVHRFIPMLGE